MPEQTSWWELLKWPIASIAVPLTVKALEVWNNRRIATTARQFTATERREMALATERESLAKEQREIYERVEVERDRVIAETERLRLDRRALERDRDRGWNLARHHYRVASELLHALNNARFIADELAARSRPVVTLAAWRTFEVPDDMEAPYPRMGPSRPAD